MSAASTPTDGNLRGLHWSYALLGVADGTLLPFIPLLLVGRGLSPAGVGVVLAATAAAWFSVGLATAYLADRRLSPERMVVLASVGAAGVALLLTLPGGLTGALVVVALTLVRSPLMLLDPITLRRLRQAPRTDYARIRLRTSAGWAVSSIASGAVFQGFGLRILPFVYAPLALTFGGWAWRSLKPMAAEPAVPAATPAKVKRIPAAFGWFLVCCFLLGASLAATQNFLTLQINGLGGGALLIGAAAGFQALTEIPTMAYIHVLTRYLSHRWLFVIGCAIYLVIYVAWALVTDATVAALLKLVGGVAFALTFVAAVVIANELVPSRLRATGQALMKSVLFGVAPILGALGGGFVYDLFGARVMFLGSTFFVIGAGLLALLVVPTPAKGPAVEAAAPPAPEPAAAAP
jgi:MFS transporter, PPP family, 3-phenylpropionic acid transporter